MRTLGLNGKKYCEKRTSGLFYADLDKVSGGRKQQSGAGPDFLQLMRLGFVKK